VFRLTNVPLPSRVLRKASLVRPRIRPFWNDSIAIFEVGFITDDLVVTVAYEFSSKHFEISPDQLFAAEDQKLE